MADGRRWYLMDDMFYCRTLPFFSRKMARELRFASLPEVGGFSFEDEEKYLSTDALASGFHSRRAFEKLLERFAIGNARLTLTMSHRD